MSRYYEDYTDVNLMNKFIECNSNLAIVGQLYENGRSENPSDFQSRCAHLHDQGYDYGEQIHDIYAGMGGLYEEVEIRYG